MINKKSPIVLNNAGDSVSRRLFLKVAGSAGLSAMVAPTILMSKSIKANDAFSSETLLSGQKQDLNLSFYNRHTGESLKKCTFWAGGEYDPEALKAINRLFRDHRTGDIHEIDTNLLHLLHNIQQKLDSSEVFHLISGYRSPKSNKLLNSRSRGVAKKSLHLHGKAADIYMPGRTLKQVQAAAKSLKGGGVGRYSQFVHVDTGRVRYWGAA